MVNPLVIAAILALAVLISRPSGAEFCVGGCVGVPGLAPRALRPLRASEGLDGWEWGWQGYRQAVVGADSGGPVSRGDL